MAVPQIVIIVGSSRSGSINQILATALEAHLATTAACRRVRIDDLPMYNPDQELARPGPVQRFTEEVVAADAVVIVTPEHNRSLPAMLKSAIDWGSRPREQNVWRNKVIGIAGASPGASGAVVALQHLRQVLGALGAEVMGGDTYVQIHPDMLNPDGILTGAELHRGLELFAVRFTSLVNRLERAT